MIIFIIFIHVPLINQYTNNNVNNNNNDNDNDNRNKTY